MENYKDEKEISGYQALSVKGGIDYKEKIWGCWNYSIYMALMWGMHIYQNPQNCTL